MNFSNIVTALCKLAFQTPDGSAVTSCGDGSGIDAACLDPEYAADNPTLCPDGPDGNGVITITGFYVVPATSTLEIGGHVQLESYLTFSNGQEKKVTDKTAWVSNYGAVAILVTSTGQCTGESAGIATVTGSYRGYSDYSQLTVVAACTQAAIDVALVIDRSESMLMKDADGRTRLAKAIEAAQGLVDNLRLNQGDRAAVISFAGIYDPQPSPTTPVKSPSGTTHLGLSNNPVDIGLALTQISISNCQFTNTSGLTGSNCMTGIGQGLKLAQEEFTLRGNGNRHVIVLLTDGMENICSPDPMVLATTLKATPNFYTIVVIALAVPNDSAPDCSGTPVNVHDYLTDLASCDLFYTADTPNDLIDIYSKLPHVICDGNLNDSCFYYIPPVPPSPPAHCYRDRLDYTGFINWDVIGKVDLVGRDLYVSTWPGEGPFVDLVGTDLVNYNAHPRGTVNADGALQSKTEFTFTPGSYVLTMELAGSSNMRGRADDQVLIQVGSLLSQTKALHWNDPFASFDFPFNVSATTKAKVLIKQYSIGRASADFPGGLCPVANNTIGNYVKNISLTNLTTSEVLLTDDFADEGVCP